MLKFTVAEDIFYNFFMTLGENYDSIKIINSCLGLFIGVLLWRTGPKDSLILVLDIIFLSFRMAGLAGYTGFISQCRSLGRST